MDAAVPRAPRVGPVAVAVAILALATATIVGAFLFQAAGYAPCELCLEERLPFYTGMALAAVSIAVAWGGPPLAWRACFAALALVFLFSTAFGAYHAGVEWGWWPGPADCTGSPSHAATGADFLRQLQSVKVVRCDSVAIRILGLSLAGWNAIVSFALVALAVVGLTRSRQRAPRSRTD